jgi:enamine deaminase RidA (YjgF/YER057c/UK114 family)
MTITFDNPESLKHRSDAVIYNGIAHISGALASDVSADITGQTEQVLAQLDDRLARAGTDKRNILSATIWLTDLNEVGAVNKVWNAWVVAGRVPARACVQAGLQHGAKIEIALIAAIATA